MRKDLLDKYKIDAASIKTIADVEAMFKTIKAGEPNMSMVMGAGGGAWTLGGLLTDYDVLGDGYGVLLNRGQNLKVVNLYETPEYADRVKLMRKWFQAGYVYPDAATTKDGGYALVKAGKLFSFTSNMKPGFNIQASNRTATTMVTSTIT